MQQLLIKSYFSGLPEKSLSRGPEILKEILHSLFRPTWELEGSPVNKESAQVSPRHKATVAQGCDSLGTHLTVGVSYSPTESTIELDLSLGPKMLAGCPLGSRVVKKGESRGLRIVSAT